MFSDVDGHVCLKAEVAARIFVLGQMCAFMTGLSDRRVRRDEVRRALRILRATDSEGQVESCVESLAPTESPKLSL